MFTGLIETTGTIQSLRSEADVVLMELNAPSIAGGLKLGDSVAVSGACLTVVKISGALFSVEIMRETMQKTKFSDLKAGSRVNLERAMRLDSRLDGHLVSGHIDGVAKVSSIEDYGRTKKYFFEAPAELVAGIIPKGSVAVDGVSLTVIDTEKNLFSVGVIPTTLSETTLSALKAGDRVNIETDMIGKFVRKFVIDMYKNGKNEEEMKNSLSWDKLVEYGCI